MITILVTKYDTNYKFLFKLEDFIQANRYFDPDAYSVQKTSLIIKTFSDVGEIVEDLDITETPEEVQTLIEDALVKEELRATAIAYTMPDGNNIIFKPASTIGSSQ